MQIGIVGLKSSGKTTLFEVLIGSIFSGFEKPGEAKHGVMPVPDDRVDFLEVAFKSKKVVQPSFELVDLPALQTTRNPNDKSGVKIMEEFKRCDALLNVVRQFGNPAVPIPEGGVNPSKEKSQFETELILTDLTVIENRLERIGKLKGKLKDAIQPREEELLEQCKETLENELPLSTVDFNVDDAKVVGSFQFLTRLPLITVVNIDELEIGNEEKIIAQMEADFKEQAGTFAAVACQSEKEILELDEEEREMFEEELGISEKAPAKLGKLLVDSLNLIRFLTGGEQESRSWIIRANTKAPQAGGAIHTDIEKGFIRVEVVPFTDFKEHGSEAKCKEKGLYRLEGKDYIVKDGDMVFFRFNV